jgi:hypothetical protein
MVDAGLLRDAAANAAFDDAFASVSTSGQPQAESTIALIARVETGLRLQCATGLLRERMRVMRATFAAS